MSPDPDPQALLAAHDCARRARRYARSVQPLEAQAALEEGRRALADLATPNEGSVALELARATLMYFGGEPVASIEVLLRARADAARLGLTALEADCAATVALHLFQFDRTAEAVAQAADALHLATVDDHAVRYRACLAIANTCQSESASGVAFRFYRRALDEARAMKDDIAVRSTIGRMGNTQAVEAMRLDLLGQLDAETLRQAIVGVRSAIQWGPAPHPSHEALEQVVLAMLLRRAGDVREADSLLTQWRGRIEGGMLSMVPSDAASEHALCRLALGDLPGAVALAHDAYRHIDRSDLSIVRPKVLHHIARVLRAADDPDAEAVAADAAQVLADAEARRAARGVAVEAQLRSAGLLSWLDRTAPAPRTR